MNEKPRCPTVAFEDNLPGRITCTYYAGGHPCAHVRQKYFEISAAGYSVYKTSPSRSLATGRAIWVAFIFQAEIVVIQQITYFLNYPDDQGQRFFLSWL